MAVMVMEETTGIFVWLSSPQPEIPPSITAKRTVPSQSANERRRVPESSHPAKPRAITTTGALCIMPRPLAANVRVAERGATPDGVTVDGLKLQETPAGSPEQANVTAESKPLMEARFRVTVAGANLVSVTWVELAEREKSGTSAGATMIGIAPDVDPEKLLSPL